MDTQLIDLKNIHSLTEFKRNTAAFLDELRNSGLPLVLTINGKAALVVQEAGAYQKLIEAVDQIEAIVGIKEGLASMDRGEGRPAEEVLADLRTKFDIVTCAAVGPPKNAQAGASERTGY